MNPSLRKIVVAAASLSVAAVLPISMATPASATTTDDPVQTVIDSYCHYDFNVLCQP